MPGLGNASRVKRTLRFEPRSRRPRGSPCLPRRSPWAKAGAKPQVLVKGKPGVRLELAVTFQSGRKHLPTITLRHVA